MSLNNNPRGPSNKASSFPAPGRTPHLLPLRSRGRGLSLPGQVWGFSSMETPGGLEKAPLSAQARDPSTSLSAQHALQLSNVTGPLAMLRPAVHACLGAQACLTLCDPMGCSPPGSSVHGVLQARILEPVAMPSSRGSPHPGIELSSLHSPALAGGVLTTITTWEALLLLTHPLFSLTKVLMKSRAHHSS